MKTEIKNTIVQQSSAVYGIGVLGAMVYFVQTASGFWMSLLGLLKAMVWPAFLVYKLLEYFKV